jgi:hypothetical protein
MAALPIKITAAGYAALRNAQGNGTNAVIVATAGLSSTAFAPGAAVPNELKRVATIAGGATAANTIHVTISDTGTDVYSLRGFGLYLTDGTLLGSYGQADVIVEKSGQAAMLLAVDIQFADIDATQITFGDTNFSNPQATTERLGVVELATDDETTTGTDSTRAITPKSLLATLNARLGVGAPSGFVKTLLAAATALAFRTALGIKSAATFEAGADNGLDADKLDGQHGAYYQAWNNLTGVPASFPPGAHTHAAVDITSGIFPVARGGTGVATVPAGSYLTGAPNGTDPMVARTPAQVLTDIAAAPKSHSHVIDNVTGLQDALDGKAAKVHTHTISDVTGLQGALESKFSSSGGTMTGGLSLAPTAGTSTNLAVDAKAFGGRAWVFASAGSGWGGGAPAGALAIYDNTGDSQTGLRMQMVAGGDSTWFGSMNLSTASTQWTGLSINNGWGRNWRLLSIGSTWSGGYPAGTFVIWDDNSGARLTFATGGSATFSGAVIANGGFQNSDRRLKKNVKRRAVLRGFALKLAHNFREWEMKDGGRHDVGHIAQFIEKLSPWYVIRGQDKARMRAVDKAGIALEASLDNALGIAELNKAFAALQRRIEKVEHNAE